MKLIQSIKESYINKEKDESQIINEQKECKISKSTRLIYWNTRRDIALDAKVCIEVKELEVLHLA